MGSLVSQKRCRCQPSRREEHNWGSGGAIWGCSTDLVRHQTTMAFPRRQMHTMSIFERDISGDNELSGRNCQIAYLFSLVARL